MMVAEFAFFPVLGWVSLRYLRAASAAEAFLEAKSMRGEWVIRTSVPCDRCQDRVWRGGG